MVQRKVPSKLGIQAEHVKSEKKLSNLKLLSSSQNQDGKSRGADMKKKMKKSRSIKLSDLEALQSSSSSPSRRSLSLHTPTTTTSASPQKQQPLFRTVDGSPNYMKPTSSSHAKKELFLVSQRNTQPGSDFKNLPRKFSSGSKAACVNKPAKALTRTSNSLSLVRTLTKTTSFKASRACSRKSTRAVMCAAPQRATCSSTLKDSKFPAYLMLSPGGTQSEGTSAMKVCPYTYCSLNGHHHADLPPLKSFVSVRRRLLKTQKRMKLEALSPRRLKVLLETQKEDSDVEQNVFDVKPACDEIGIDIFIEIYPSEKDSKPTSAEGMGRIDFLKEIEDHEDNNKSTIEDNCIAVSEEGVMRITSPSIGNCIPSPSISEIDLKEDLKKSSDDAEIGVDATKERFLQEQNEGDSDEDHQSIVWSYEEMSIGSYCSDGEQDIGDVYIDDSDSKTYDMEWEEERLHEFEHDEDADSSVYTEEDNDTKVESSSESSHDVSVTWLDDILGGYYEDFLVDETHKEANSEERTYFEEQPSGTSSSVLEDTNGRTESQEIGCDQSSITEEIFEYLTNTQDNGGKDEKHKDDDEASCNTKPLDEETIDNPQCQKMSETCKIEETNEDGYSSSLENNDESNKGESQIELEDVSEKESNIASQDQDLLDKDQGKAKRFQQNTSCIDGEEENTCKNWKDGIRRKKGVEDDDDDEMRKFNPKEPNFLPLVPEHGQEKVDLRHQVMDERKNSEAWMLDCALRQVVTKLAPARKKKVALLVEAFEMVLPAAAPKCETSMRNNNSSAFGHSGSIEACS